MKNLIILGIIYCISCNNNRPIYTDNESNQMKKKLISLDCIFKGDTIISKDIAINYVPIDSFYTIKVKINGYDTLLNFGFDCMTPHKYIPRYFDHKNDAVFLVVRSSPNYREIIICELINKRFRINHYVTEIANDSHKDVFVYELSTEKSKLYVQGIFNLKYNFMDQNNNTKSKMSFILPKAYINETFKCALVNKDNIVIQFKNKTDLIITLK